MKKLFVSTVSVAAIGFSAAAQKMDESKVPAAVRTSFAKRYPAQKENGKMKTDNSKPDLKKTA